MPAQENCVDNSFTLESLLWHRLVPGCTTCKQNWEDIKVIQRTIPVLEY